VDEPAGRLGTAVRHWPAPLGVAAGVALVVLVALPFSGRAGPTLPGLTSAWCAIVLLFDLLSVTLLVGLYRNGHGLRMLVLATAFAWSAIVVLAVALTTPGVARAGPWLGSDGGEGWLYVFRHVGPPILIALAMAPWPAGWDDRIESRGRQGRLTALAGLAVLVLGPGSVAMAVTTFPGILPRIADPGTGHFRPLVYALVLAVNLVGVAVGLYGVAQRGNRSAVEVWAIVAAFAWLGDVVFVGMLDDRFSVAFYGARLLAVLAALIVPASILVDTWRLHQRLTAGAANLEAQVSRLLEAKRIRDHVSAVISHDMRAPLAGLHGYLELLVDDEELDSELVQRMHERSLMLTRRLTLMCEDLLAATTIEHTDLVVTAADLDLSQQLAECASGFPDLDLRIGCPRGVQVHADPLRLQQILSNLVRNAQVHGAEPVTVDVSADSQTVTLRVSDAGEGVPESFIPRLFERYSQGARAASGAGIGLSVVHDLVQAHGGTIRYDLTQPAFIVTLPVGAPTEPPAEGRVLTAPRRGHVTT
jgi:signal transduction histidine kinase